MKRCLALSTALLALSGCLPLSLYYKDGAPVSKMESVLTDCELLALSKAPVIQDVEIIPGYSIPPRTTCDSHGNCTTIPGRYRRTEVIVTDLNAGRRQKFEAQCMSRSGYRRVSIPTCSAGIANATPPRITTVLPTLTAQSCVIRNRGGSWQIVNPGQ